MKLYGLTGYPLSHSFSSKYFTEKFEKENIPNSKYINFEIPDISVVRELIRENADLTGLNVTIPHKEKVMPFLDAIDEAAAAIGAVNTIKINRSGDSISLKGYNTDQFGFKKSILPFLKEHHRKALILGTGGASKAVKYVLTSLNIDYISASIDELKEKEISYRDITKEIIDTCKIIINCTPLGTYPKIETCPDIPYQFITHRHLLFDLVYNPEVTKFLEFGLNAGATIKNGLEMLHQQAEKAYEIWNS